ncbi:MAG: hypothetical protein LBV52_04595, partial [Spirochaetaceae bacterium]|nr:hypothetical protein [Spirochaetaceae bacterium]
MKKTNQDKGCIFNKIVSLILLFTVFCSQIPAISMPDNVKDKYGSINKEVFDYHFSRADMEKSPEEWMKKARQGLIFAEASWEKYALQMLGNGEGFSQARQDIIEWNERELQERFSKYISKKYSEQQTTDLIFSSKNFSENENTEMLYHLDEDGNVVFDSQTGDPLIIRPDERSLINDSEYLNTKLNELSNRSMEDYSASIERIFPELLAYINRDDYDEFERIFSDEAAKSYVGLQSESARIRQREQQMFNRIRSGDIWSLRKKSENEAADVISSQLISTVKSQCNEGIDALQQKIDAAKAGTEDINIAGQEWLAQYQEQFNRGIKAWEEAEERFFYRRIEWEQDAGKQFTEGQEAWDIAFNQIIVQKDLWEQKAKALFDSGEKLFKDASLTLNKAIYDARVEFEKDAEFRITAGSERAAAWVNTYITSSGIVVGAQENIDFWAIDLKDEYVPSIKDSGFQAWLVSKPRELQEIYNENLASLRSLQERNREWQRTVDQINAEIEQETSQVFFHFNGSNINQKRDQINMLNKKITDNEAEITKLQADNKILKIKENAVTEIAQWYSLYTKYIKTALDARNALVNDFSVIMGSGALADVLNENVSSEDFNLDEYQVELIRAQAVSNYWKKRLDIAKAVEDYAKELSAGRITNTEGVYKMESAKAEYDAALEQYKNAQQELQNAGNDIEQIKIRLTESSNKLNVINNDLYTLNKDYSILISIKQLNDNSAILYEIADKYKTLLQTNNLLKNNDDKIHYINYLERLQDLDLAQTIEQGTNLLKTLICGRADISKSLLELSDEISSIWIPETEEEIIDNIDAYGVAGDNLYYSFIQELLVKCFADPEDQAIIPEDIPEANEETETSQNNNTTEYNYKQLLLDALGAAKEIAMNNYNEVISVLRLLTANSTKEWYISESGIDETEDSAELDNFENTGLKQLLEQNLAQSEETLLEKLILYQDSDIPSYVYFIELKNDILDNQRKQILLSAYDKAENASQCIIDEKAVLAMRGLKNVFDIYGIEYESEGFPGMKETALALHGYSGSIAENYAAFVISLYRQIENMPVWVQQSFDEWMRSFTEYIAAYSIYYGLSNNFAEISSESEQSFYQTILLNEIVKQKNIITTATGKHWREYVGESFLSNYNKLAGDRVQDETNNTDENTGNTNRNLLQYGVLSKPLDAIDIKAASNYKEGNLADKFEDAEYFTRKLNDSFKLDTNKGDFFRSYKETVNSYLSDITKSWNEYDLYTTEFIYKDAVNSEYSRLVSTFSKARNLEKEIHVLASNYEIAADTTRLDHEIADIKQKITGKQNVYNTLLNNYQMEASEFISKGENYDRLYTISKNSYNTVEEKRFEYEKQDAIRRWAATSYLDYDNLETIAGIEYKNPAAEILYANERYERSNIVLDALKDLYNSGEARRPYQNEQYNKLYEEYKISFERMLTSMKTKDKLEAEIRKETKKNDELKKEYKNYLSQMSADFNVTQNDTKPSAGETYELKDLITVDSEGRLVFNRGNSFTIKDKTPSEYNALYNYFNEASVQGTEKHESTQFELALRKLSVFLEENITSYEKYIQWAYARDYLISQMQGSANGAVSYQRDGDIGDGKHKDLIIDTLFQTVSSKRLSDSEITQMQYSNWAALSDTEKKNLEFYTILTLQGGGNENPLGFSRATNIYEYEKLIGIADTHVIISIAVGVSLTVAAVLLKLIPFGVGEIAATILFGLAAVAFSNAVLIDDTKTELNKSKKGNSDYANSAFSGLENTTENMQSYYAKYKQSCDRLAVLEGTKKGNDVVTWTDINLSLRDARVFSSSEINVMKKYWEEMSADTRTACKNVPEALGLLVNWTKEQRDLIKHDLEKEFLANEAKRVDNQKMLRIQITNFIDGNTGEEDLRESVESTYGRESPAIKNHIENIESVLIKNLNGAISDGTAYTQEYANLINELLPIINTAYSARYNAELQVRIAEWEQKIIDLNQKEQAWREASQMILARGRSDWKKGTENMQAAYNQWVKRFNEQYTSTSGEWDAIYLLSLQEKAEWVSQATEAANSASSNVTLSILGSDAERRARIMDARDPDCISTVSGIMESQKTLSAILSSAGITNIENAFGVLNNSVTTISTIVRTGMAGSNIWNSAATQIEAAKMVKEANEALAEREAKIIAANVRRIAADAVNNLKESVDRANKSFSKNMDDTFILQGSWERDGSKYRKDVVIGSSAVGAKRENVSVQAYKNYEMEPIVFKTDLSEERLSGLESFAVQALVNKMSEEIQSVSEDIFGKRNEENKVINYYKTVNDYEYVDNEKQNPSGGKKQILVGSHQEFRDKREISPGKFGTHIGYAPLTKEKPDPKNGRSDVFDDYGTGELGRLMQDYIYWSMKESVGYKEMSVPSYNQPLWYSDSSWFKAPSIKNVTDMVISVIVTVATWGAALPVTIGYNAAALADDVAFALLDGMHSNDWGQAGIEFGKKALTTAITTGAGAVMNGVQGASSGIFAGGGLVGKATANIGNTFGKTMLGATLNTMSSIATGVTNTAINSLTYSKENGFGYSVENLYGGLNGVMQGAAVSMAQGLTQGLLESATLGNTTLESFVLNDNEYSISGYEKMHGFDVNNIADVKKIDGLLSGIAGQGLNYAMTGDFALNLLNINDFLKNDINHGLLEMHLGNNGVSMNLGQGGIDASFGTIVGAMKGLEVLDVNAQVDSYAKKENFENKITLRAQYGFGDAQQKNNLYDIFSGKAELNMVDSIRDKDGNETYANGITELQNGKRLITIVGSDSKVSIAEQLAMAIKVGHEAYRDGIKDENNETETQKAVLGHTAMMDRIINDGMYTGVMNSVIASNLDLLQDYINFNNVQNNKELFNAYINNTYDSSDDFWKLVKRKDGSYGTVYDGNHSLLDEKGKVLVKSCLDEFDSSNNIIGQKI